MKKKTFFSLVLALMSIVIMPSCDNGEYSPIKASTDSCQIVVSCVDRMGQDLLSDKEFLDAIKIEGDTSHSRIRYDVITSGDKKALLFVAELPDQSDMKWTSDRKEASGISKITIKFKKGKLQLKCHIKYIANRPPAASGGKATIEEVQCNNMSYKRTGNAVSITFKMDKNGKLI